LAAVHCNAYEGIALYSYLLESPIYKPLPPATLSQHDMALGTLLYVRVVGVLLNEVAEGNIPSMKGFLESEGRPTFQDLMMWAQSTGCAQGIHLYDDIDLRLPPNDLETPTINIELKEVVDLTWAFNNITKYQVGNDLANFCH
jgi:hypothetical protein